MARRPVTSAYGMSTLFPYSTPYTVTVTASLVAVLEGGLLVRHPQQGQAVIYYTRPD